MTVPSDAAMASMPDETRAPGTARSADRPGRKRKSSYAPWSEEEIAILKRHYADLPASKLAAFLPGRTPSAINDTARPLRLKRPDPARFASVVAKERLPDKTRHPSWKGIDADALLDMRAFRRIRPGNRRPVRHRRHDLCSAFYHRICPESTASCCGPARKTGRGHGQDRKEKS